MATIPTQGLPWDEVRAEMQELQQEDRPWYGDRMFIGGSYFGGEDLVKIANEAYQMYINCNGLYATKIFPSLVHYTNELVDVLLNLHNAPAAASGSITTGGTESLLMAVKTAHAWSQTHRPQAKTPEIIIPHAAHPGFDKAAHLMGLRSVRLPHDHNFHADVDAMRGAINDHTIMLAASAPSYPFGITDPVAEIAALAVEHELWLHVDACNGGFVFPFARQLGYSVPVYDFALAGVTSISIDVHKLGYANKGVSSLLLRDAALEQYQRYTFEDWPCGLYSTQNLAGSHSGGGLASAWAVMRSLGEDGYRQIVGEILTTRDRMVKGISALDGLQIWGEPHAYLIAYGSDTFDIFAVDEGMAARGWMGSRLTTPPSIHLFLDRSHAASSDDYLRDLAEVVDAVKAGKIVSRNRQAVYAR